MYTLFTFGLAFAGLLGLAISQDTSTITITSNTVTGSTVVAAPTSPPSSQYTNDLDLRTSVLNSTNFFRYEHSAQFLAWNQSLADYATNWANQCMWEHSHGPPGENLARGYPDVTSSVDAWGNERDLYDFSTPTGFTEATGHFTQLVWADTQSVGCAAVNCNGRNGLDGYYLVCEYWPPGNIQWNGPGGQNRLFQQNVQPERSGGSQGFNEVSATIGATGVTGQATGTLVPTGSPSGTSSGMHCRTIERSWSIFLGALCLALNLVL